MAPFNARTWLDRGFDLGRLVWLRAAHRHALSHMSRRMLEDIGLDPEQVAEDLRKPFWQRSPFEPESGLRPAATRREADPAMQAIRNLSILPTAIYTTRA